MNILETPREPRPGELVFLRNIPRDWWNIDVLLLQVLADAGYTVRFMGDAEDGFGAKHPEWLKVMVSREEEAKISQVYAKLKRSNSGLVTAATVQGNVSVLGNLVRGESAEIGPNRQVHPRRLNVDPHQLRGYFVTAFAHRIRENLINEEPTPNYGADDSDLALFAELLLQGQLPLTLRNIRKQLKPALVQIFEDNPRLAPQPKN